MPDLHIAAQTPKVLFRTVETERATTTRRFQTTQLTLIKSRMVLNSAIRDEKVSKYGLIRDEEDPIKWLQDNLESRVHLGFRGDGNLADGK